MTAAAVAFASLVAVAPAQAAPASAVVSGTVSDTAGPVAGADVTVFNAAGDELGDGDVTDVHGDYSIGGLPAGNGYTVYVEPHNGDAAAYFGTNAYTQSAAAAFAFNVAAAQVITGKDVTVPAGASISGTISDANGPVAGAVVTISDSDGEQFGDSATTDVTGAYTVAGLPPTVSLTVGVVGPGGAASADAPGWLGSVLTQADASYLTLTVGQAVAHQDVVLTRGGFIAGVVTDAAGAVAGAAVTVLGSDGSELGTDTTDTSGHYDIGGLPAGSYSVNVDPASDADAEQTLDNKTVTVGATTTVDFTLVAALSISGTVKNAASAAIPGASVLAFDATDPSTQLGDTATTAADGSYTIGGLPAGSYLLEVLPPTTGGYALQWWQGKASASAATSFDLSASTTLSAKDFTLVSGGTITGHITDGPGKAVPGAVVTLLAGDGSGNPIGASATTDASGSYTIVGVPAGSYQLGIDPANGVDLPTTVSSFAVTTATVTKDVTLVVGGTISGTVTDAGGPVIGAVVHVVDSDGDDVATSDPTNSTGAYAVRGLPFGSYSLQAVPVPGGDASQWLGGGATQSGSTSVAITAGGQTVAHQDFTLISGGFIAGTVTDAAGPVDGASVVVTDGVGTVVGTVLTAANGSYTISSVPAGSNYSIDVTPSGNDLEQILTGISVTIGATTTVSPVLIVGASISGIVSGPGGAGDPVVGATVTAYDADGDDFGVAGVTDGTGAYTITTLPAGSYYLQATPAAGSPLAPRWLGGFSNQAGSTQVTVTAGAVVTGKDFALVSGGTVTGKVTDATGNVSGATVTILSDGSDAAATLGTTTTASDGTFSISGVTVGSGYVVNVDPGDSSDDLPRSAVPLTGAVTAGGTLSNQNIVLEIGASISGVVNDAGGHVAGVTVYAVDSTDTDIASSAVTDSSGAYRIGGLPYGATVSYWLRAVPGAGGDATTWYAASGGASSRTQGTAIPVTAAAQSIGAKNITLNQGGFISGTVTDGHGPVQHVVVTAYNATTTVDASGWTAETDANGTYTISGVPEGSGYSLDVSPAAGGDLPQTVTGLSVVTGLTTTRDVQLVSGGTIKGTVRDSHGAVASATVTAYDLDGDAVGNAGQSDAAGAYTVSALPSGHYTLFFAPPAGNLSAPQWLGGASDQAHATYLDITAGQELDGKDATLVAGGTIAGTITGNRPFGTAGSVSVLDASGNTAGTAALPSGQTSFAYSIGGLAAGSYTVSVDPDSGDQVATSAVVSVSSGAIASISVTLQPGAIVSGTLTDASSHAPVAGADVQIVTDDGTTLNDATSDANGVYAIKGIAPGPKYTLEVQPIDGHAPQWWTNVPTQDTATYFALAANQTLGGHDFALAPGTGVIGTVIGSNGQPAANADVQLYDTDGNQVADGTTDSTGDYVVGGQLPGTYTVEVVPDSSDPLNPSSTDAIQWWGGAVDIAHAHYQSLAAAAPATVNFTLVPGATFSGVVTGSNGQPSVGASVTLEDALQNETITATTDSTGAYSLQGVPAGSWTLDVAPVLPGTDDDSDDATDDDDDDSGPDLSQDLDPTNDGDLEQWLSDSNAYFFSDAKFVATAGATKINASFQLHEPGILTGKVLSVTKKAVSGADVDIVSAHGDDINDATTSASGGYRLTMLPPGSYKLTVTPDDSSHAKTVFTVAVTAGAKTTKNFTVLNAFKTKSKPAVVLAAVGKKAYVSMAPWSPKATKFTYQWMLGGKPIAKATHPTFTVPKKLLGKKLSVVVTGSAKNYAPTPVTSAAVVVKKGFAKSPAPKVSGKAVVGQVLKATNGTWKPKPSKFGYQWFAGGKKISGATHASFKVTKKQLKLKITVVVTATKSGYAPTPVSSKATGAVKAAPKAKK